MKLLENSAELCLPFAPIIFTYYTFISLPSNKIMFNLTKIPPSKFIILIFINIHNCPDRSFYLTSVWEDGCRKWTGNFDFISVYSKTETTNFCLGSIYSMEFEYLTYVGIVQQDAWKIDRNFC